jgi:hypothetical protein
MSALRSAFTGLVRLSPALKVWYIWVIHYTIDTGLATGTILQDNPLLIHSPSRMNPPIWLNVDCRPRERAAPAIDVVLERVGRDAKAARGGHGCGRWRGEGKCWVCCDMPVCDSKSQFEFG